MEWELKYMGKDDYDEQADIKDLALEDFYKKDPD